MRHVFREPGLARGVSVGVQGLICCGIAMQVHSKLYEALQFNSNLTSSISKFKVK